MRGSIDNSCCSMTASSTRCLIFFLLIVVYSCNHPGNKISEIDNASLPDSVLAGKKLFESNCVRCHGMDATGLTGPSLRRLKLVHAPDRDSFTQVVEQGIQGTGMPSNWSYSDSDCYNIYAWIGYLKQLGREIPPGDTAAGRLVYQKAGCNSCHLLNGQGSSIGPDLSMIGAVRNAAYIKESILDPGAALPESTDPDYGYGFSLYLPVELVTMEGKEINGLRVNEDSYTIQVKDLSNNFYSFNKEDLKSFKKEYGKSLMPSFRSALKGKEIENLVAYLYKMGNE
jgi:cytochrome c oxidase cbb3-type subunit III